MWLSLISLIRGNRFVFQNRQRRPVNYQKEVWFQNDMLPTYLDAMADSDKGQNLFFKLITDYFSVKKLQSDGMQRAAATHAIKKTLHDFPFVLPYRQDKSHIAKCIKKTAFRNIICHTSNFVIGHVLGKGQPLGPIYLVLTRMLVIQNSSLKVTLPRRHRRERINHWISINPN